MASLLDIVIVVPDIFVTVVPDGMPLPITKSPTSIPELSETVIV